MLKTLTMLFAALLISCSPNEPAPTPINENPISLTAEEAKFVQDHRVVTWVVEENRPPFIFVDGVEIKGISQRYLSIISRKTGLIFKPVSVESFTAGIEAVKKGEIDLMTSVRPTSERTPYLGFSAPYVYNRGVFIFRQNSQPHSPLRAGLTAADAAGTYLMTRFPDMQITETLDNEEAVSLLEKGLLDVVVMNEASADYLTGKSVTPMRKAGTEFDYPYSFAFKKENAVLGSILSKAIASMTMEEKQQINEAWRKEK